MKWKIYDLIWGFGMGLIVFPLLFPSHNTPIAFIIGSTIVAAILFIKLKEDAA